jgi:hypothetical protein
MILCEFFFVDLKGHLLTSDCRYTGGDIVYRI